MTTKNIFNLDDVSDLPAEVRKEIMVGKRKRAEARIAELFHLGGGSLSIDQIVVAHYRIFGEPIARAAATSRLHHMSKGSAPLLEALGGGKYVLRKGAAMGVCS